ncbi:MAG: hypothetical protein AAFY27_10910, partial [Pseudomonadota bacterium]
PDKLDDARDNLAKAVAALDEDVAWRTRAASAFAADLDAYYDAIKGTIGLRQQPRLPRGPALAVAACQANHRDISLSF